MTSVAAIALGAAAGGFVQGLSGFAFGLVALGIWAWTVDPSVAGPLAVFGSLLGQTLALGTIRRSIDRARLTPFIVGGLLGVPVGVALLRAIDPLGFRLFVGVIPLVWCPSMLLLPAIRITWGGRAADASAGWIGGVMGGLGGLTGPAPTLWCTLRQAATLIAYVATGTVTTTSLPLFGGAAAMTASGLALMASTLPRLL